MNPKGQATIPLEVRRTFGVDGECRELELVLEDGGFRLRPHKPALPVRKYIGYCAEELREVTDAAAFVRELRGRGSPEREA
ncbi:MAG: AbrB/MazE/SpoVT family DNA-binding domain-containing protein [Eubacteriales bacterium]